MNRSLSLIALLGCTIPLMVGCGKSATEDASTASKRPVIAVIPKGTTHEFWKSIHAGAIKAAQEENVEILWKGPLKEDDRNAQIQVVENMMLAKVDAMVLAPLDNTALRGPVAAAKKRGIPTVIIDSALDSDDYVSFVSTENKLGGSRAGQRLADLMGYQGRVAMLRYQEGSASTMSREAGFLESLEAHQKIEVVSANQYGGATAGSAQAASENLLARFRLADGSLGLDGIFCPNESTTFGMLLALREAGYAGKVKFVGFDSSERLVDGLRSGEIGGLVLQNPINMGYLGVKMAAAHLRGEPVEKRVDTGSRVATPETIDDPQINELLTPPFDKWLNP